MFWVIQENVAREERHEHFVEAVERLGDDYALVKHIPFTTDIIPDIDPPLPVIAFGSVTLCQKIAPKRGWITFTNSNFDFRIWSQKWKGNILNDDAKVSRFRKIERPMNATEFFIRPVKDNKAFTGTVMDFWEYQQWLGRLFANEKASDLDFDLDEQVMVSSVKKINQEIRFFIVDDKVVTHTLYQVNGRTQYFDDMMTDPMAIKFVNDMMKIWTPDRAFVMDVALVDDKYKIIEINSINSAGLYKADVHKLVDAISQLVVSSECECENTT